MLNLPYEVALEGVCCFIRIGGILFAVPFFGDQATPIRVRVLLAVALSLVVYPTLDPSWLIALPSSLLGFSFLVIKELFIGLFIGYVAKLVQEALIAAATIVGFQMGFGTASLLAPNADYMMDSFTAFHRSLVILFFLALNLHHIYLSAITETFRLIPAGSINLSPEIGTSIIRWTADIFVIAMRLASPVLISLLFTMAALGLISRAVPQLQVFTMSFPVSFFIGLVIYLGSVPFFPQWFRSHILISQQQLSTLIQLLGK